MIDVSALRTDFMVEALYSRYPKLVLRFNGIFTLYPYGEPTQAEIEAEDVTYVQSTTFRRLIEDAYHGLVN